LVSRIFDLSAGSSSLLQADGCDILYMR
jgi:hypothetical protein